MARTGGGPSLVEAKCYRFLSHTTDDDDRTYRTREEVEERRPTTRFPASSAFWWKWGPHADDAEALKRSVLAEANEATDRAEAMPYRPGAAFIRKRVRRRLSPLALAAASMRG